MDHSELERAAKLAIEINLDLVWWGPQRLINHGISRTSAYFIAAANPATILALLAENKKLKDELAKADEEEDRLLATANEIAEKGKEDEGAQP
jgi:hypothetical protein